MMEAEKVALLTSRSTEGALTTDYWDNNNKGGTGGLLQQGYEVVVAQPSGWRCRLLAHPHPDPDPDLVNDDDDPQHGLLLSTMGHLSLQQQCILR